MAPALIAGDPACGVKFLLPVLVRLGFVVIECESCELVAAFALLEGSMLLAPADLAYAPNHQIADVEKHDPHDSIETQEG